jgi:predicted Zn-dependent peptidase
MNEFELLQLNNGIRIIYKQVPHTKIVHCGFTLDIGSRDEKPDEEGLAHFWEHMAFKGTKKRRAFHIINRLESVGGELNAYTTKEKICFYASVLQPYFDNAFELLADITFDSIFPEKQIERERNVILEEMAMYFDTPEDAIQDEFDNVLFPNHPLGHNILGTESSVKSFNRENFKKFIHQNLNTSRIIVSCVGNLPWAKVRKVAEKYLKKVPTSEAVRKRKPFVGYSPRSMSIERHISQVQAAIGRDAYSLKDPKRLPFFLLANILGGPGMNSRLNLALREKYGFVYAVEASFTSYIDTGMVGIFFGTEPKQYEKSNKLVLKELKKLRENTLGTLQLHRSKVQLMGQLAMSEENNASLMLMMAKSMLDLERIDTLEDLFLQIEKITAPELLEVANEIFQEDQLSFLTFLPVED